MVPTSEVQSKFFSHTLQTPVAFQTSLQCSIAFYSLKPYPCCREWHHTLRTIVQFFDSSLSHLSNSLISCVSSLSTALIPFATTFVSAIVFSLNYCNIFPFSSLHSAALVVFLKCKTVKLPPASVSSMTPYCLQGKIQSL